VGRKKINGLPRQLEKTKGLPRRLVKFARGVKGVEIFLNSLGFPGG